MLARNQTICEMGLQTILLVLSCQHATQSYANFRNLD